MRDRLIGARIKKEKKWEVVTEGENKFKAKWMKTRLKVLA